MKILYFTEGANCTPEQRDEARAIGAGIRNGRLCDGGEPCDYVAGAVPDVYAGKPLYSPEPEPAVKKPKRSRVKKTKVGDSGLTAAFNAIEAKPDATND